MRSPVRSFWPRTAISRTAIFRHVIPAWLCLPVRKFQKSQDGVTAIEFGLIAVPFFAMLTAIIEVGLYFFASQVFDSGFRDAARMIRTGQAVSWTREKFISNSEPTALDMCKIVNQHSGLFDCSRIFAERTILASYGAANANLPLLDGNLDTATINSAANWACPEGEQIVQVRAFYEWPSYANLLGSSLLSGGHGLADGNILIAATAIFKTEPFGHIDCDAP